MLQCHRLRTSLQRIGVRSLCQSAATLAPLRAAIFDIGGVLMGQPQPAVKKFLDQHNLPLDATRRIVKATGNDGAFQRLERGEIELGEKFFQQFQKEAADLGLAINARAFFGVIHDNLFPPNKQMIDAVQCLRAEGIKTAILSNNWRVDPTEPTLQIGVPDELKQHFDVVVESALCGMRKPDKNIYEHAAKQLNTALEDCVFVDDSLVNIYPARELGMKTVLVGELRNAIAELECLFGIPLRGYVPGTSKMRAGHELDIDALKKYLVTQSLASESDDILVRQFKHGQSNPTFHVRAGERELVLRKKPPGKLLPGAHAVEREFKLYHALHSQGVPVPRPYVLCEDTSIIGTAFYVMDYVRGRIFKDLTLKGLPAEEKTQLYQAMIDVLVKIHSVDINKAGLSEFGKGSGFFARQAKTWTGQYRASVAKPNGDFEEIIQELTAKVPENKETCVVHGDFRLDNLIFHPEKPIVLAVLDWELATIGCPLSDVAYSCIPYYLPNNFPALTGFKEAPADVLKGIPSERDFVLNYYKQRGWKDLPTNWPFYISFAFFRVAAIMEGVRKRASAGQASNAGAKAFGDYADIVAKLSNDILKGHIPTGLSNTAPSSASNSSASSNVFQISDRAKSVTKSLEEFIKKEVLPLEAKFMAHQFTNERWSILPEMEVLKEKAKLAGLWNLFLPIETDKTHQYGADFTNLEYAPMAELMGRSLFASEVFNCSAPDTGNMETILRYGTEEQKKRWLVPLLDGKIRSCFAMTEPAVASSDATNISASIEQQGSELIINGHKHWISGAMDPRCKIAIFLGKSAQCTAKHQQHTMVLVPMDTPGIRIVRPLSVFGFDDAPHGHAEIIFENVRVPASNILLDHGAGFAIAQGRLGPGRIHHCMRLIGHAERALELMCERAQSRVAFGKTLAEQGSVRVDIARSRLEIDQIRLLTMKAASLMDTVGNKEAKAEIAMIKIAAPEVAARVLDRAMQVHGGLGLSNDTPLAQLYAWARVLKLADGPSEVHLETVAKLELHKQNKFTKL